MTARIGANLQIGIQRPAQCRPEVQQHLHAQSQRFADMAELYVATAADWQAPKS